MRKLGVISAIILMISTLGCNHKKPVLEGRTDHLAQYRDTIVGNFNGSQIDTIICEPLDSISDTSYRGFHYRWRVFAKNKSVNDLLLGNTIGIHFVKEGDLDGDGADEWGYVTEWETSNWMMYQVYTYTDKNPQLLYEPLPLWLFHIDPESNSFVSAKTDIAAKSDRPGMVNVKFSDVRNDGEDFLLIDTIVPLLIERR